MSTLHLKKILAYLRVFWVGVAHTSGRTLRTPQEPLGCGGVRGGGVGVVMIVLCLPSRNSVRVKAV